MHTVMVVDDSATARKGVSNILEDAGFGIVQAKSAEKALKKLKSENIDLIVLDMTMPGMGGIAFLKKISVGGIPKYPVLVLTGRGSMAGFFQDMTVAGFLTKPPNPEELIDKCTAAVRAKAAVAPKEAPRQTKRVLLVEDDPRIVSVLTEAVGRKGFEIAVVGSGYEAMEKAVTFKPDVALVKQIMRGMNGAATAAGLKKMPSQNSLAVVLYDETMDGSRMDSYLPRTPDSVDKFCAGADPSDITAALTAVL